MCMCDFGKKNMRSKILKLRCVILYLHHWETKGGMCRVEKE